MVLVHSIVLVSLSIPSNEAGLLSQMEYYVPQYICYSKNVTVNITNEKQIVFDNYINT